MEETVEQKISIVIPVMNEEENVANLYDKIIPQIEKIQLDYEIIFIDDGSSDNTMREIRKLNSADKKVAVISFSRNFGHQAALLAGMKNAKGDIVVTMDGDMQHPAETIPKLYEKYKEGYDIVNTRRIDDDNISAIKKETSTMFYKFINLLSDTYIQPASSDFRLMNRKTVKAFLEIEEQSRFTRGIVSWLGFSQAIVEYYSPPRKAGKSKYTIVRMFNLALNGITSFSGRPLRLSFFIGLIICFMGIIYSIFAIINSLLGNTIIGWTSLLVSILLLGGIQLISIGVLGEYIARIFTETKKRPHYFINEKISNDE